jgi:Predicted N-acetylglucosaminyl transferase
MARTALDRAERLFASGRYADLVSLLEPQLPVYRESQRFYYLLGCACMRSGDHGGAWTYLKRAEQLSPSDRDSLLALAALAIRKGETEKAVEYYLRILEERPEDRKAKSCLSVLRREGSPEGIARLVESGRIERLYPPNRRAPRFLVPAAAILVAAAALSLLWPVGSSLISGLREARAARPEVAAVSLSQAERSSPVVATGSFRYVLTEKDALDSFERAKDYFQQYRDNAALKEINRLLLSNASDSIKEKARSLKAFVGNPDFRTVKDAPSFAQAMADPALYEGCSVVWKGMAANVRQEGGATAFDFLVGYQDKKRLEGTLPAAISGAAVPMDRPLELLGRLRVASSGLSLDCLAVHELAEGR